ncbi:MAG: hypothetical protein WCJ94_07310 [bacterium]
MEKSVTFTMKLDKKIRDEMKGFCKEKGFVMKTFVEKAIMDRIEKEEMKEDLAAIKHFEKYEEGKTVPYDKVAEELGLYGKKKKKNV